MNSNSRFICDNFYERIFWVFFIFSWRQFRARQDEKGRKNFLYRRYGRPQGRRGEWNGSSRVKQMEQRIFRNKFRRMGIGFCWRLNLCATVYNWKYSAEESLLGWKNWKLLSLELVSMRLISQFSRFCNSKKLEISADKFSKNV